MEAKKLTLKNIEIRSFVAELNKNEQQSVKGGMSGLIRWIIIQRMITEAPTPEEPLETSPFAEPGSCPSHGN